MTSNPDLQNLINMVNSDTEFCFGKSTLLGKKHLMNESSLCIWLKHQIASPTVQKTTTKKPTTNAITDKKNLHLTTGKMRHGQKTENVW